MNGMTNESKVQIITPRVAQEWLEAMHYDDQRKLRQVQIDRLAADMKKGAFSPGTSMRVAILDGKRYLIDGQHRLWAVLLSDVSIEFVVVETTVQSQEQIAWLYGNTDIGLRRTAGDLFGPLGLADEFGMSRRETEAMGASVVFMASGCLRNGGNGNRVQREDQIRYMRAYASYAREYLKVVEGCSSVRMRHTALRTPTLAVALLSFRFSLSLAVSRHAKSVLEFWRGAIFDDGIPIGDARKFAYRHLIEARLTRGQAAGGGLAVSPAYSARYLAGCLNAYMDEREVKFIRVGDERQQLKLYGAPGDPALWW